MTRDTGDDRDSRPSPDALLEAARRQERGGHDRGGHERGGHEHVRYGRGKGRLKIFLGAAPGVGKTYAMLEAARLRRREGIDVVAAVVETHGRVETANMLAGLDVIPRRQATYRDQALDEMDLDAVLRRKPELALVDELAHTNAPGSRHPKRYLDVEELLVAGIDVYTTLNVQHVESLNTVVAQITRVRVRETVPDSILDGADDIEAIDLSPEDLIQRLQEGKVYVPHQAERALRHFFSPGNLTALRELALRRTAQRVDAQLLAHMRSNAISGPWAAGERVLVCVGDGLDSAGLVRHAKRTGDRLRAPVVALHVETHRTAALDEKRRDRIAETLRLAGRLDIEAVVVPSAGHRVADDVLSYARANNVTQIVVGKATRPRWFEWLNGSVVFDLVRNAGDIGVHVIAVRDEDAPARASRQLAAGGNKEVSPYAGAAALVGVAFGVGELVSPLLGGSNIDLIFLTAIVGAAISFGLFPSLFAVVLSVLSFNFFFLPPLYTFTITDPSNVAALFCFTLVAVLVSNLTARVRSQATIAGTRARTTEQLYAFSRKLASAVGIDDVLWTMAYQIASMLKVRVVVLLPEHGRLEVRAGYPPEDELAESDLAAANWSWERNASAGRGADTLPGAARFFAPLRTARGPIGVVGLDSDKAGRLLTPEEHRLFDALLDQGALAVERVSLAGDLAQARRLAEADKLRAALLTSISHDLRTPLASVLGSATTIRDFGASLGEEDRTALVATVIEEAERLNRFIANLLDMTRLEAGAVRPNLSPSDVGEIVVAALARAATILKDRQLEVDLEAGLPPVPLDSVLFEQAVFNILDNAAKYAGETGRVAVELRRTDGDLFLTIADNGPGIPKEELEAVFEKFHRVGKSDHVRPGTGLGLAISRGFIEAMGGTVTAGSGLTGGAVLTIRMPISAAEPSHE